MNKFQLLPIERVNWYVLLWRLLNVSLEFLIDLSFFSKPLNDSVSGCSACEERWNVSDFNFQTERHDMLLV